MEFDQKQRSVNSENRVAILLGTYNGEKFLQEQLDSILAQTYKNWIIYASDDGSSDSTLDILYSFQKRVGKGSVNIKLNGSRKGFVANYLSLVCDSDIQTEYYAYCDQDDIWEIDKLARAVVWLNTIPKHVSTMYCSRTRLINASGEEIGFSPLFQRPPSFGNALVQSIAGANTIVFNAAAKELLSLVGKDVDVPSHDWWTYLVITACGGQVKYDPYLTIRYRQHTHNVMGTNRGLLAQIKRIKMGMGNVFRDWTNKHVSALNNIESKISSDACSKLSFLMSLRNASFINRVFCLKDKKIYRQSLWGDVFLKIAILLKKI